MDARSLRQQALETLDQALAASGRERAMLLSRAVHLHRLAVTLEESQGEPPSPQDKDHEAP